MARRRVVEAQPRHQEFRNDVVAVLRKHAGHLSAEEMLALAAHLTGQVIALQDQRTMSPQRAMEIVIANLEAGNDEAMAEVQNPLGTA
jgi:hypothetical protein